MISSSDNEVLFGGTYFSQRGGVATQEPSELNFVKAPYESNALRFEFALENFAESKNAKFQSYLEGLDEKWTEFSNRSAREVTNLVWGEYTLQFRAKLSDGTLGPISQFHFEIEAPWFEQPWFYGMLAAILFLFMVFVSISRVLNRFLSLEESVNLTLVSFIVGYGFTKVGAEGVLDSISGGAETIFILLCSISAVFMQPFESITEKVIEFIEDQCEKLFEKLGLGRFAKAEEDDTPESNEHSEDSEAEASSETSDDNANNSAA